MVLKWYWKKLKIQKLSVKCEYISRKNTKNNMKMLKIIIFSLEKIRKMLEEELL
jgi:hypothetical protein